MRILICGARDFDDITRIDGFVGSLPKDSIIIEGEAKGADSLARDCSIKYGLEVEKYPADWNTYGRGAGPIRNKQMLIEGKPDIIIGYSKDIKTSKGTKNMLTQGIKAGVPCYLNALDIFNIDLGITRQLSLEDLT